jgi:phosphomannomutase
MLAVDAQLGGEGNGGVILKQAHLGRDSLVGTALVLHRMAQTEEPVSKIHANLPQFEIVKDRVRIENVDLKKVSTELQKIFTGANVVAVDGLKFSWFDCWIHLRKSNTEPILRIYAEAPEKEEAENLVEKVKETIKGAIK